MLKFLKMKVAEDVTIMEEALVVVLAEVALVAKEVLLQEEKVVLHQEEKVQAVALEAIEIQLQEKVDLAEEAILEVLLQEEKVVFHLTDLELKVHQIEHLDALKALVMHQDQEDQEETNIHC
jgi:hypothetical protein